MDEATGKRRRFITGNRCEKGAGTFDESKSVPNLYEYKSNRLFNYEPLAPEAATRATVGMPRALNMYENYPFWFTFFTKLGFRVVLSDPSTKQTYEAGIESMPSESVCYPAKLSHGHIMNLLDKRPDFIWFPCSKWERQEDEGAGNHFNCPIVASYAEALRLNIDELRDSSTQFLNPWLPYDRKENLKERLYVELVEAHPELMGPAGAPTRAEVDDARGSRLGRGRGVQARHPRQRARRRLRGWRPRARTASCWRGVPTITTPRSTTPSPSF